MRYRRTPHLVAYWAEGELVLHDPVTARHARAAPALLEVLAVFGNWLPVSALRERLPHLSAAAARRVLTTLVRAGFMQRRRARVDGGRRGPGAPPNTTPTAEGSPYQSWAEWHPVASAFHAATRDRPYTSRQVSDRLLRDKARREPPPSPLKHFENRSVVRLPPFDPGSGVSSSHSRVRGTDAARGSEALDDEFVRVLLRRRTWRRFGKQPIALSDLAALLYLTFGVQRWVEVRGQGRVALKTSPSGGARHSIEAYVLALNVTGLSKGLYHYDPAAHALALLSDRVSRRTVGVYLPTQQWYAGCSALVLMTSVFERVRWRYPSPRAYRVVLAETGHLGQTFCLAATALGLAPFCTMALGDSLIERDLGIDGVSEAVLYAVGVGTRPRGVEWAPWPDTPRVPRTFQVGE